MNTNTQDISPYRQPATSIVYRPKKNMDWGPLKRSVQLGLVAIPWIAPLIIAAIFNPISVLFVLLSECVYGFGALPIFFLYDIKNENAPFIKKALCFTWYPIYGLMYIYRWIAYGDNK